MKKRNHKVNENVRGIVEEISFGIIFTMGTVLLLSFAAHQMPDLKTIIASLILGTMIGVLIDIS